MDGAPRRFVRQAGSSGYGAVLFFVLPATLVVLPFRMLEPLVVLVLLVVIALVGIVAAVRHFRARPWTLVLAPDALTLRTDQGTRTIAYSAVEKVFWQVGGQAFLSLKPSDAQTVRLVLQGGESLPLGLGWERHDELARDLVGAIEEARRKTLDPKSDLDFGEVKFRGGSIYVGEKALPPRTTCEVRASKNYVRFEPPEGRAINVPLQWISHPKLVEELVNERAQDF